MPHDTPEDEFRRWVTGGRISAGLRLQNSVATAHSLLRTGIRAGLIVQDEQLVEDALVHTMGMSRNAVRSALQMLADEKLISRAPRRGTEVIDDIVTFDLLQSPGAPTIVGHYPSGRYSIKRLEARRVPPLGPVAHRLRYSGDKPIPMVEVLMVYADRPCGIRVSYNHPDLDEDAYQQYVLALALDHEYDPRRPRFSSGDAMMAMYGSRPGLVETTIEARMADARMMKLLDIATGGPILVREVLTQDAGGTPRALQYNYYDSRRVVLAHQGESTPAR